MGACPEARQTAVAIEQRRQAILKEWRERKPPGIPLLPADAAWTRTLPAPPSAAGVMDDLRVYVPLRDASFAALTRETGTTEWTQPLQVVAAPAADNQRVYLATADSIRALDATSGRELWSTAIATAVTAPLTLDSEWLLAAVEPGEILALRRSDGTITWRRPVGARTLFPAASSGDGALYLSLSDNRVVALELATGELLWEQRLPGVISEPAAARDRVFVGSTDNVLYAFQRNGTLAWKWRNGGDVIGVAVDNDAVYIASLDNIIRAVNRGNGNQRWRRSTVTRPTFPPRAYGGTLVLAGVKPAVTSFVGSTGADQGTFAAGGELVGPPLVDAAPRPFQVGLVTITREGVVEALRPRGLVFRDTPLVPLRALPGRMLARDRMP
ncbi:MAG: PQQ-binding-like beta-propeller repeat protein [Acidobacteria bacterium]|nr:PQQ-binding-like beta-propeller repeat protein [Acidobacteriota bacterium]